MLYRKQLLGVDDLVEDLGAHGAPTAGRTGRAERRASQAAARSIPPPPASDMTSSMALPPTIVAAVVMMRIHPPSTPRVRSRHIAEEARKRTPTMRQGPALDRMTPASLASFVHKKLNEKYIVLKTANVNDRDRKSVV